MRKTMTNNSLTYIILLQLFLIPTTIMGTKVPALIVFGDSTVDAGNNNQIPTVARSNYMPYGQDFEGGRPTGRFCNGRLYTDFISDALGIKSSIPAYLDPAFGIKDFATGVTFGSAGAGFDNATSHVLYVIPIWKQLEYFKEYKKKLISLFGRNKATTILQEALYIVSIGTNDFIENYFILPVRPSQFTANEYELFILKIAKKFINDLYELGARKISVAGLPISGCLPAARSLNLISGRACKEDYNKVSRDYNVKLQNLIVVSRQELVGIQLVYSDLYYILSRLIQHPYLYGFENFSEACCGTGPLGLSLLCTELGNTCADASKFVFWDFVHPTEKTYSILADYLMNTSLTELV